MQIRLNFKDNLVKAINSVVLPKPTRSYEWCIKADTLRFAKLYLDSIMLDRNNQEAYLSLVSYYKYLNNYDKVLNTGL